NIEMKDLKSLADDGKKQLGSGVVAIVGVTGDGKAGVVVGVTSDLASRCNAVDLARVASQVLGGKGGGGRPDMAQAGGPDGAKAGAALSAIEKAMASAGGGRGPRALSSHWTCVRSEDKRAAMAALSSSEPSRARRKS